MIMVPNLSIVIFSNFVIKMIFHLSFQPPRFPNKMVLFKERIELSKKLLDSKIGDVRDQVSSGSSNASNDQVLIPVGPITRARAKKLKRSTQHICSCCS